MWGGFSEPTDARVERFTSSLPFDRAFLKYDLLGSIAHCAALEHARLLSAAEAEKITAALKEIGAEGEPDTAQAQDEDIHSYVERRLIEKVGPLGGKLHAGRSRNEQAALDMILYLKETTEGIRAALRTLRKAIVAAAKREIKTILPGYTHLQRAQPVLLAHHLLAYREMFRRDENRLADLQKRFSSPLGSGALAGSGFPLDRERIALSLGLLSISENSIDAVSDRDLAVEFLSASALIMVHLSRLAEETVLWSTEEFGFLHLSDRLATGSSMMPQKRNPDLAELIRGKSGRVFGSLLSLLVILKGLPLAYNRDLQEDKEPLFDAARTVKASLEMATLLIRGIRFDRERMARAAEGGALLATELADYLVEKGVPFREAHQTAVKAVRYAARRKKPLAALPAAELSRISTHFGPEALKRLTAKNAIARRNLPGGTAQATVAKRIAEIEREP